MHQQQSAALYTAHGQFINCIPIPTSQQGCCKVSLTMGVEQLLLLLLLLLLISRVANIAAPIAVAATEVSKAAGCAGVPFFVAARAARAVAAATRDTEAVALMLLSTAVSELSEKVSCRVLIE